MTNAIAAVIATLAVAVASPPPSPPPAPSSAMLAFRGVPGENTPRDAALEAQARRQAAAALGLREVQIVPNDAPADADGCRAGERGLVTLDYAIFPWITLADKSARREATVSLRFTGCYGTFPGLHFVAGSGSGEETAAHASTSATENAQLLATVLASALTSFEESRASDAGEVTNLIRYGIPLGDAERSAFVAIQYENGAATVVRLDPAGTAARAGLKLGDHVTAINGVTVTEVNLVGLVSRAEALGRWVVRGTHDATFEAQSPQWYASHGGGYPRG